MADDVSQADRAREDRRQWAHDWYSYDAYLTVHDSHMRLLEDEGLVINNYLVINEVRNRHTNTLVQVQIEGAIYCKDDVVIFVDKWLAVRKDRSGRDEVKGDSYSYHALIRGNDQYLIRYDCAHGPLHKHDYEPSNGRESIVDIDLVDFPTLSDFIRDAIDLRSKWP